MTEGVLAVVAVVLAVVQPVPQLVRTIRRGTAAGVAPEVAWLGTLTNGVWLAYGFARGLPAVVVVSANDDPRVIRRALDHGAAGFIPKDTASDVLLSALRLVLAGGTYIPPTMLDASGTDQGAPPVQEAGPSPETGHGPLDRLTPRQREVLRLIAAGMTNKSIAQQLDVTENTVKVHITSILKTLGVSNRTQAVITAQQWGLDD